MSLELILIAIGGSFVIMFWRAVLKFIAILFLVCCIIFILIKFPEIKQQLGLEKEDVVQVEGKEAIEEEIVEQTAAASYGDFLVMLVFIFCGGFVFYHLIRWVGSEGSKALKRRDDCHLALLRSNLEMKKLRDE